MDRTGENIEPSPVSLPLKGVGPEAVLSLGRGLPRGFWGRGREWSAWFGVATRLEVEGTPHGDPYPQLAARLARLSLDGAARLYGGFAFRRRHERCGAWEAFPAASFILPAIELRGAGDGAVLRVRRPTEDAGSRVLAAPGSGLAREAERLARMLADVAGAERPRRAREAPPSPRETPREDWLAAVARALRHIAAGRLEKVVLARTLDLRQEKPVNPEPALARLRGHEPATYVFLYEPRAGSPFLGAAPEVVASVRGGRFRATAVAGSIAAGDSPEEAERLGAALLASTKDRSEHRLVVEDMLRRLDSVVPDVRRTAEPGLLRLAGIQHLETVLDGAPAPGTGVLEILAALHPTPAICGHPRDEALAFLRRHEPFDRGWYAGPVGWLDTVGEGVFSPGLRSAVGWGRSWRLFAGAGIVEESDPEREWEETRMKFKPALRALGVGGAP